MFGGLRGKRRFPRGGRGQRGLSARRESRLRKNTPERGERAGAPDGTPGHATGRSGVAARWKGRVKLVWGPAARPALGKGGQSISSVREGAQWEIWLNLRRPDSASAIKPGVGACGPPSANAGRQPTRANHCFPSPAATGPARAGVLPARGQLGSRPRESGPSRPMSVEPGGAKTAVKGTRPPNAPRRDLAPGRGRTGETVRSEFPPLRVPGSTCSPRLPGKYGYPAGRCGACGEWPGRFHWVPPSPRRRGPGISLGGAPGAPDFAAGPPGGGCSHIVIRAPPIRPGPGARQRGTSGTHDGGANRLGGDGPGARPAGSALL